MSKKKKNKNKINKVHAKIQKPKSFSKEAIAARQDKLTNWFMINIAYIIVGYIILKFIENGYNSSNTLLYMETICWSIFGVLLLGGAALLALYYTKFKIKTRIRNYGILLSICSLGGLYLALYKKIRLLIAAIIPRFENVNSNFGIWSLMILLGIYAVASLVWYCVKLYQTSHSK